MSAKLELQFHPNLTRKQKEVIQSKSDFILLKGCAGTGKTYSAMAKGLLLLRNNSVERIVIIRSAVAVRDIGFLPGYGDEKAEPYMAPYVDLMSQITPKTSFKALESRKQIEFSLTSFMRGITLDNACIIVDEYQNMNEAELETIVTRVGEGSKLILCGDTAQTDLTGHEARGHVEVLRTLESMGSFQVIEFTPDEVVRSAFVREYFEAKTRTHRGKLHRVCAEATAA